VGTLYNVFGGTLNLALSIYLPSVFWRPFYSSLSSKFSSYISMGP